MLLQLFVEPNVKSSLLLMGRTEILLSVSSSYFPVFKTTILSIVPIIGTAGLRLSLRSQHKVFISIKAYYNLLWMHCCCASCE